MDWPTWVQIAFGITALAVIVEVVLLVLPPRRRP